jgi:DNA-directed RNA polymerase I, II, and III subunit RPABC2
MKKNISSSFSYNKHDPDKFVNSEFREIKIVAKENRRTSSTMSLYEYTEIISHRAEQIKKAGIIFIQLKNESDPIEIAKEEIKQKKCPLSIRRLYNSTIGEIWEVNELTIPFM